MNLPKLNSLSTASQLSLLAVVILIGAVFITVNSALQQQSNVAIHATGGLVSEHVYRISNRCGLGLAMDVDGNSMLNGAPVDQSTWSIGGWNKDREWIIKDLGNGYFSIKALSSLKYLDVKGNSTVSGEQIVQYLGTGSPTGNEQWKIVYLNNGYYKIVGKNSGLAIGLYACSGNSGLNIRQYSYAGEDRLQWKLTDQTTVQATIVPPHPTPTCPPPPTCFRNGAMICMMPVIGWCGFHPTIAPTCIPRPACLDAVPRCLLAEPIGGWCPTNPTPTCTPRPVCQVGFCTLPVPPPGGWCPPGPTMTPEPTAGPTQTPAPSQSPSSSPVPSDTPVPGDTVLKLTVGLHGIGTGGDSANPNSQGNMNPLHPSRSVTVDVYDTQNQLVTSQQGTINFDSGSGKFNGAIDLGASFSSGLYTVKVKTDQYLRALVPGIQTITAGQVINLAPVTLVAGDINGDNAINIIDYNMLIGCYSDLLPPTNCPAGQEVVSDLTDDGHVNQFDYNLFLRELTNIGGQ